MKKALTPVLAVVAVIAIVCACVFGVQNGSNKTKLDETSQLLTAANDSAKALEAEKTQLSADLETKVSELTAKVTELEGKLAKTERALTAAQSNAYIMFANADWSVSNWGTADSEDELSMFRYFLASPPLAMALRLAIIAALLALFVNARRRQRAIPLPTRQHNATLHFLRQVAALYRPTDDYTNLLAMRYKAFADKIRRRTGADILDIDDNKRREAAKIVAVHTGEDFDYVHNALRELHFNLSHERAISLRTFRKLVDIMNRIQQKL